MFNQYLTAGSLLRLQTPRPSLLSPRPRRSIDSRTVESFSPQPLSWVPNMSGTDLNFHIGDKVVYPNHGVGVIEQISSRSIGASVEKFYLLNIKSSSLKVMVP